MFVYEKDGGLCILMKGNRPVVEGKADVEIMPTSDGKAEVTVNGEVVSLVEVAPTEDTGAGEGADEGDGPEL